MLNQITVNAQSSIRIGGETVMYFDPFRIEHAANDADIILITHPHFDHFSPADIAKVRKPETVFVAPQTMEKELTAAGITDAVLLKAGESKTVCGIPVEAVPAYNKTKHFHPKQNGWLGYIVTVDGKRIYAAGDTDATDEAAAVRCEIALIPIGGTYTTDAAEAAELVSRMQPQTVIPIHYGTIVGNVSDGDAFAKRVKAPVQVVFKLHQK